MNISKKIALILGGGGHFGIAWELSFVRGLQQAGLDLRKSDYIVGTSAGSQVGTILASNSTCDVIWSEILERKIEEVTPISNDEMALLFKQYNQLATTSTSPKNWIEGMGLIAKNTKEFLSPEDRLTLLKKRFGSISTEWTESLNIVATNYFTSEREVFNYKSNVSVIDAIAASSALPGVWPLVSINESQYFDGGSYSMENPDVIDDADYYLILTTNLPVKVPYELHELISKLENRNKKVLCIKPSNTVMNILEKFSYNTMNAELRIPISEAGILQGKQSFAEISEFLEK